MKNPKKEDIAKKIRKANREIALERAKTHGFVRSKTWGGKKTSKEQRRKVKEQLRIITKEGKYNE